VEVCVFQPCLCFQDCIGYSSSLEISLLLLKQIVYVCKKEKRQLELPLIPDFSNLNVFPSLFLKFCHLFYDLQEPTFGSIKFPHCSILYFPLLESLSFLHILS
jgi:hypothetical protein